MKAKFLLPMFAACLLTFTACQQGGDAPADMAQVKADIQAAENAWADALNTRNLDALMALYTDDAVSMPDNAPVLTGKAAIRKAQEQEFANNPERMTYTFEVLDVYGSGNTFTETGKSTYKDAAGNVVGSGKYMVVWENQDGKYLCAREMYNGDAPPAPAATRSIHLFDLPEGVSEAEWSAALAELNSLAKDLGYPGAGYHMYKTENPDVEDYRYFFEGVWPSEEAYTKIHEDPSWKAASEKFSPMYDKIKAVEIYRRMNRVK